MGLCILDNAAPCRAARAAIAINPKSHLITDISRIVVAVRFGVPWNESVAAARGDSTMINCQRSTPVVDRIRVAVMRVAVANCRAADPEVEIHPIARCIWTGVPLGVAVGDKLCAVCSWIATGIKTGRGRRIGFHPARRPELRASESRGDDESAFADDGRHRSANSS